MLLQHSHVLRRTKGRVVAIKNPVTFTTNIVIVGLMIDAWKNARMEALFVRLRRCRLFVEVVTPVIRRTGGPENRKVTSSPDPSELC
jgi:hypothetical protein